MCVCVYVFQYNEYYIILALLKNIVSRLGKSYIVKKTTDLTKESFRSLYKKRKKVNLEENKCIIDLHLLSYIINP